MSEFPFEQTRRKLLSLAGGIGFLGAIPSSAVGDEMVSRDGQKREGSQLTAQDFGDDLAANITTDAFWATIVETEYRGVTEQGASFTQELQDFPRRDGVFTVLSTGDASEASNDPEFFASTWWDNERFIPGYSPDGFDAYCVVDLEITFEVPEDVEGIGFDYQFGTEESPSFLGSPFQDFFEAQLFGPDGDVENIALVDGEPITVDVADTVANTPEGDSENPSPPLPDPPDVAYNAVTDLQEIERSVAQYQGEEVTLRFRLGDASDGLLDSAVFLDNLRFLGDVDTDPVLERAKRAFEGVEEAYNELLESFIQSEARVTAILYDELGAEFLETQADYWGVQADVVPETAVDDDTQDVLDTIVELHNNRDDTSISEQRALSLHQFYQDLSDALEDTSGHTEKVVSDYFMGTGADQDVFLDFGDDETFADVIEEDFEIAENLFESLQQDNPNSAEVTRVAETFEDLADRYRKRAADNIDISEAHASRTVEFVKSDSMDTLELHGQAFERDDDTVGSQAVVTKGALVLLAWYGLNAGAGMLAGIGSVAKYKCTGAFIADEFDNVEATEIEVSGPLASTAQQVQDISNLVTWIGNYADEGLSTEEVTPQEPTGGTVAFAKGYKTGVAQAGLNVKEESIRIAQQLAQAGSIEANVSLEFDEPQKESEEGWISSILSLIPWVGSSSSGSIWKTAGSLLIENTGTAPWTPSLSAETWAFDGAQQAPLDYVLEIKGDEDVTLDPGQSHVYDVVQRAPVGKGLTSVQTTVEIGALPAAIDSISPDALGLGLCEVDYVPTAGRSVDGFLLNDQIETEVTTNIVAEGDSMDFDLSVDEEGSESYIEIRYPNQPTYANLRVVDAQNNLTGFDPDKPDGQPQEAEEIAGSKYSGVDTGEAEREWVSIENGESVKYGVQVIAPEISTIGGNIASGEAINTQSTEVEFDIEVTEIPELDPELSTSDGAIVDNVNPSEDFTIVASVSETNGDNALGTVTCSVTEFENVAGETFDATLEETEFILSAGETNLVGVTGTVPEDPTNDTFTSEMFITSEEGGDGSISLVVVVDDAVPAGFPGSANQFNAIAGDDGEISQTDLSGAINEWFQSDAGGTIDGVEFDQDELSAIINWWFQGQS